MLKMIKELYEYLPYHTIIIFWCGQIFDFMGETLLSYAFTRSAFFVTTYLIIIYFTKKFTLWIKELELK